MSVAESNVSKRIERLLARTPPAITLPRVVRWAAVAALVPVVVLAASTSQAESPVKAASAPTPAAAVSHDGWPANYRQDGVRMRAVADPDDFYPAAAKQQGVSGKVIVEVAVDAGGQPIDVRVIDVQPASPEYGFAQAAMEVARRTAFVNPAVAAVKEW